MYLIAALRAVTIKRAILGHSEQKLEVQELEYLEPYR